MEKFAQRDNPGGPHRRAESFINFEAGGQKGLRNILWGVVNDTVIETPSPRRFLQYFFFLLPSSGQLEISYIIIIYSNSVVLLTKDSCVYIAIDKNFRHGLGQILSLIVVRRPRAHEAKR